MKKYLLNLENAKLPKSWPSYMPKRIMVRDGRHFKDFDVMPEEMEKQWASQYVDELQARRRKAGLWEADETMPIGFNHFDLPEGAELKELP